MLSLCTKQENALKVADNLGFTDKEEFYATKKEAGERLRAYLLEEREVAYLKHYEKCWDVVGYISDMAERCYNNLGCNINNQIEGNFWRHLEEKFQNFEPLFDGKDTTAYKRTDPQKSVTSQV